MYYFAYGSNMNLDHMRRLCGWRFEVLGPAVLDDFEFGLDRRGYFNIRPQKGHKVSGVLYRIQEACLPLLDEFEGHPQVFRRVEVMVNQIGEAMHKAWVYIEDPEQFGGKSINLDYFKRAITGAMENRLPEKWINFLESFVSDAGER